MSRIAICEDCKKEKAIKAKGKCGPCYERFRKAQVEASEPIPSNSLIIDFSLAPHLLEEIRRKSEAEFRPIEYQFLFELKRAMGGEG